MIRPAKVFKINYILSQIFLKKSEREYKNKNKNTYVFLILTVRKLVVHVEEHGLGTFLTKLDARVAPQTLLIKVTQNSCPFGEGGVVLLDFQIVAYLTRDDIDGSIHDVCKGPNARCWDVVATVHIPHGWNIRI